jgi:hypothetical protein
MFKFLKKLFPPDDWKIIWVKRATWIIQHPAYKGYMFDIWVEEEATTTEEYAFYTIYYSPFRKKYKLEVSGKDPKKHQFYEVALNVLGGHQIKLTYD